MTGKQVWMGFLGAGLLGVALAACSQGEGQGAVSTAPHEEFLYRLYRKAA